jgi:hypothetical protein
MKVYTLDSSYSFFPSLAVNDVVKLGNIDYETFLKKVTQLNTVKVIKFAFANPGTWHYSMYGVCCVCTQCDNAIQIEEDVNTIDVLSD